MKQKLIFIIILFFSFLFVNMKESYAEEDWRYDITSIIVKNDKMKVNGWAVIKGRSMGRNNGTKDNPIYVFSPAYILKIVSDSTGNTYGEEKTYYKEVASEFSVTCPLKFGNCYSLFDSGGYDVRNTNLSDDKDYYDNTDFSFEFDISNLNPNDTYHLELKIKAGDFESSWKPLTILGVSVKNYDDINFEVDNEVKTVKMLASGAIVQKDYDKLEQSGNYESRWFYFTPNAEYEVLSFKDSSKEKGNAKYRFYDLKLNGDEQGYLNSYSGHGWAYSAWIEAEANTYFTIKKKDSCDDASYAKDHPDICCNKKDTNGNLVQPNYPEYCCNNSNYVNSSLFNINTNWQNAICCNKTYSDDTGPVTTFYSNNFLKFINVNDICTPYINKYSSPKYCSKDEISKNEALAVAKFTASNNTWSLSESTINVTLVSSESLNKTNLKAEDISYDYFSSSDYNLYNQNRKEKIYLDKSLDPRSFSINVKDVKKINNKNNTYQVTLVVKANNGVLPKVSNGINYVPFKISICDTKNSDGGKNKSGKGNDCTNNSYFDVHKAYCCSKSGYKNDNRCAVTPTPTTEWDNKVSCNEETTKLSNINSYSSSEGPCKITCKENIALSDYPTLDSLKGKIFKSGTAFEYNMTATNEITCTLTVNPKTYDNETKANNAISKCDGLLKKINDFNVNNFKPSISFKINNDTQKTDVSNKTKKITSSGSSTSKFYYYTDRENNVKKYINYPYSKKTTYTFKYDITLSQKYINKYDGTTTENDKSKDSNYISGANAYYSSLYDPSGIYNFSFLFNDESVSVIKKIYANNGFKNNGKEFTCQFNERNKFYKYTDDDDECVSDPEKCPNPPDVSNGYRGFYFRPISLTNPFPNGNSRKIGSNWLGSLDNGNTYIEEYIYKKTSSNNNGNIVYSKTPMYEITLTPQLISDIRNYNSSSNSIGGYMDWSKMNETSSKYLNTSNFLDKYINNGIITGTELSKRNSSRNE